MSQWLRDILLSSGDRHPLMAVAGCLGLLASHLEDKNPESRRLVYDLRQLCLGFDISKEQREKLREHDLVTADGSLEPVMKDAVLAAVRGEGHGLYLVSPFTEVLDRSLVQFLDAKDRIESFLPREEAERLLASDPLAALPTALKLWASRAATGGHPPSSPGSAR